MRLQSFTIFFLLIVQALQGQNTADLQQKFEAIDQRFQQYNRAGSPGFAIGIIKDGTLIFSKGYGHANLDYNIPISDSSLFYIGSMAKQFTTAALLILEAEGKIDFTQTVQTYLPDFPVYEQPITVKHLIHHTSGIRGTNSLQLLQGVDLQFEEVFDTDDLHDLIVAQKELNFPPGQQYRYSSGCYAVLAKVVEAISGKDFRTFLEEKIFNPLGMDHTFVCDDHNEVIPNRVTSYWQIGDQKWERRSVIFDAYGDGGIMTCVNDLVQWDKAFYEDLLGVEHFADKMYTRGILNNGDTIGYAFALNISNYKGQPVIYHNGGMLGYRVDMMRFPEQQFSVIALANGAGMYPTSESVRIANIFLKDVFEENSINPSQLTANEIIPSSPDINKLEQMTGYYWRDDVNNYRRITRSNDSIFLDYGSLRGKVYLKPTGNHRFAITDTNPIDFIRWSKDLKRTVLEFHHGNVKIPLRKFNPTPPQQLSDVTPYVGKYYSPELGATYNFHIINNEFRLQVNDNKALTLFPISEKSRIVWNGKKMCWLGFGEIKFQVEADGKVNSFRIGDSRVAGVEFVRTEK